MAAAVRPDAALHARAVRVVAAGTLFVVNTLSLDGFPDEGSSSRAKNVARTRGGTAPITLAVLAQLGRQEPRAPRVPEQRGRAGGPEPAEPAIEAYLVAALGGDDDGRLLIRELHDEGVSTKYSKILDRPVPTSWVFLSESTQTRTVVHHNSIPDITHVEFVELLGPLLIPENYNNLNLPSPPPPSQLSPRPSFSSQKGDVPAPVLPELPLRGTGSAPFDILLFEARSVPQTLSNMQALDGLARERGWRDRVAICLEMSRSDRQGVEILIRNADVVFFSKAYALGREFKAPRPFLLSMVAQAAPHALLVVNWGSAGAALLSVPTREYFQSSGWTEPVNEKIIPVPPVPRPTPQRPQPRSRSRSRPPASSSNAARFADERRDLQSVRSGSQFWADGRGTPGTGTGTTSLGLRDWDLDPQGKRSEEIWRRAMRQQDGVLDDEDDDSRTEDGTGVYPAVPLRAPPVQDLPPDEAGAQNAFVAGMLYSLTKRVLPGAPYSPVSDPNSWHPRDGPWRLEECLKFATELAGRKARRPPGSYDGLAHELRAAGWFAA